MPVEFLADSTHIVIALADAEPVLIDLEEETAFARSEPDVHLGRAARLARPVVLREANLNLPPEPHNKRAVGYLKSEIDRAYQRRAATRP